MDTMHHIKLLVGTEGSGDSYAFAVRMILPVAGDLSEGSLVGISLPDEITKKNEINLKVKKKQKRYEGTDSNTTEWHLGIYRLHIGGSIQDSVSELNELEKKFNQVKEGHNSCHISEIIPTPEYKQAKSKLNEGH